LDLPTNAAAPPPHFADDVHREYSYIRKILHCNLEENAVKSNKKNYLQPERRGILWTANYQVSLR
jgi:hypothetical protein